MRVVVVGDTGLKDAVIAGPFTDMAPVLFVGRDQIPSVVQDELVRLSPDEIVVFGGPVRVSDAVVAELAQFGPVTRIAGASVFDTAVAASQVLYPPSGMFVPRVDGPVLTHDGTPTVHTGNIVLDDGQVHNYSNIRLVGSITARNGTVVNITDSELDGNQGRFCAAGWGGTVNLERCEVWNAEDGLKDQVNTVQVTVHNLYKPAGAHSDAVQLQNSGVISTHRWSCLDAGSGNSAIIVKNDLGSGARQTILVEDCYLDGGNYTVFLRDGTAGLAPNARFLRCRWGGTARYGVLSADAPAPDVWDVIGG